MDQSTAPPQQPAPTPSAAAGWLLGPLIVGMVLSPLLLGVWRPVGGDPDRLFRPVKAELAQSLRIGELPFWSDRLGLGFPLLAESHAAALYPPNWLLYRLLDVDRAYDLAMWAHHVALASAVALYARGLGITPQGAALSAVAVALSGFLSIHASHEWAYHALLYAVLVLLAADRYATTGRLAWFAALVLASGMGWTVGHFQMQAWGLVVAAIATLGRLMTLPGRLAWLRGLLMLIAIGWGAAVASAQLAPSWELARWTGSEGRDRLFYSYPPAHAAELAWPTLFRSIDPENRYWFTEQTTGYESCLFVGIPALMLAILGALDLRRPLRPWLVLTAATFAMATMPRWWPTVYQAFTAIPFLGLFRCPARWTAFSSLGLALLGGAGFDRAIGPQKFKIGLGLTALFALGTLALGVYWRMTQTPALPSRLVIDLAPSALVWLTSLSLIIAWRRRRLSACVLLALAAVELGVYYYRSTTVWGRDVNVPIASPLFVRLAQEPDVALVAGPIDDLPLRAGIATAEPYVGFTLDPVNATLRLIGSDPRALADPNARRWLDRIGVSHAIVEAGNVEPRIGTLIYDGPDPALDDLARSPRPGKRWRLYRRDDARSGPRLATRVRLAADDRSARDALFRAPMPDQETVVAPQANLTLSAPLATSARLLEHTAKSGRVEHNGPCLVVLDRIHYPGWSYRLNSETADRPTVSVEGGRQALWIDDKGETRYHLRYEPTAWPWAAPLSVTTSLSALILLIADVIIRRLLMRRRDSELARLQS